MSRLICVFIENMLLAESFEYFLFLLSIKLLVLRAGINTIKIYVMQNVLAVDHVQILFLYQTLKYLQFLAVVEKY